MTAIELTNFNRRILNSLLIVVRQNQGAIFGSWFQVADLIQTEMGGVTDDEDVHRMRRHLMAVGFDHLTEGSPLAYFRAINGDHHFVERGLLNE
ncbi:hypothetical protein [Pseudomonas sp.]|uniref:hypothetical protein n=1 Tax=Pseudomonas sp. TaxID=306 RepID=UPI002FC619D3